MLSNSCRYGIRSILFLAANTKDGIKMGVKTISASLEIPQPFLAKILQELSKKRVISSVKGVNGGFYLTEDNLKQNLLKIIEVIDGINPLTNCVLGLSRCNAQKPCPVHEQAEKSREAFFAIFRDKTIGEIAAEINESDLRLL